MAQVKTKQQLALNYFMRHGKAFPGTEDLLPPGLVKTGEAKKQSTAAADDRPYVPVDMAAIRRSLKRPPKPGDQSAMAMRDDYFQAVEKVKQDRKVDFVQAATIVNRERPDLWQTLIQKHNPNRKLKGGD